MNATLKKRQHTVNPPNTAVRTAEGDAFAKLAFSALRLAGYLTEAGDALTKPLGQSSARWQVLAAAAHGPMSVAQIAGVLGMSRQGVQRVADLLVDDGLAEYQPNPRHKRAKLLRLLPKGEEVLAEIRVRQTAWANALGAHFNSDDLSASEKLLKQIAEVLAAQEEQKPQ